MSKSANRRHVRRVIRKPRPAAEPLRTQVPGEWVSSKIIRQRSMGVGIGLLAIFCVAGFTQVGVQALWHKDILDKAQDNGRWKIKRQVVPSRGAIWSADHKILARTEPSYEFSVDFTRCPKVQQFYAELASALDLSASEFMYAAQNPPEHPVLDKNGKPMNRAYYRQVITPQQHDAVMRLNRTWKADGISLSANPTREYPLHNDMSGVLGMFRTPVTRDRAGNYIEAKDAKGNPAKPKGDGGIEGGLDQVLQGQGGFREGMLDKDGEFLPLRMSDSKDKADGQDVTLTIHARLQQVVADQLRITCEKNKAENGVAVVMDPKTGDVLACANWPNWDPATNPNGYDFNPVFHAAFEPGSTFKILTLAKALDDGKVHETDTDVCHGGMQIGKWHVGCHGVHGVETPEKAIAESCNVAAGHWAMLYPKGVFFDYIKSLGLAEKTNVGVQKEIVGNINEKDISQVHTAISGFGQGIKVTPIALASAFCSLANGGMRVKPRLIERIGEKEVPTQTLGRLFKPETTTAMLRIMESVISSDEGTGHMLRIPGYHLAGKTGTAERKGDKHGGYVANFVGFVPSDAPRAVILVMVNRPQGGQHFGAQVAGPVFHEVARDLLFNEFKIPREMQ